MDEAYLSLVIEEAAEVIHATTKIIRFGPGNRYLSGDHEGKTNAEALAFEVGDLTEVLYRLNLPSHLIEEGRKQKQKRLKLYGPSKSHVKRRE